MSVLRDQAVLLGSLAHLRLLFGGREGRLLVEGRWMGFVWGPLGENHC